MANRDKPPNEDLMPQRREPLPLDSEAQKQWAEYSAARFESAEDRVKEFRNWARQLAGALAVIIGFEVNLIAKIFDSRPLLSEIYPVAALVVLFGAAIFKTVLIFRTFPLGYAPQELLGPEGPVTMRTLLVGKNDREAREIIARYYANACDGQPGYEGLYAIAENLGASLKTLSRLSAIAVTLLVGGALIWAAGSIACSPSTYNPATVAEKPKSPPPPPAPQKVPSPSPTAGPVTLPTPTKGVPLNEGTLKKK